jgi:hypothetical protein
VVRRRAQQASRCRRPASPAGRTRGRGGGHGGSELPRDVLPTKLAIGRAAASDEAKALQAFSDRWSAKPLVAVEVGKGKDGWGVTSVTLSPFGFVEKKVFGGAADRDDGGDAPPRPGTGRRRSPRAGAARPDRRQAPTPGRCQPAVTPGRPGHDALDRCQVGPVGQLVRADRSSSGSLGGSVGGADGPPVSSGN